MKSILILLAILAICAVIALRFAKPEKQPATQPAPGSAPIDEPGQKEPQITSTQEI